MFEICPVKILGVKFQLVGDEFPCPPQTENQSGHFFIHGSAWEALQACTAAQASPDPATAPPEPAALRAFSMPLEIEDLSTDPFWSGILFVDGQLDQAKVAAELMDFALVWRTLGKVINERAEGMSGEYKVYTAEAIIQQIDAWHESEAKTELEDTLDDLACQLEAQADTLDLMNGDGVPAEFIEKHQIEARQLRFIARLVRAGGDFDWDKFALAEMDQAVAKAAEGGA